MFSNVMLWFALPITALTLLISLWYEFFVRRKQNNATSS
jgi:cytochrome c-type biogenesis protein CcmH/NrfF